MNKILRLTEKLEKILDEEHAALLNGRLEKIETLSLEKVTVLETVSELSIQDIEAFEHLRARLLRNQSLAQSAIAGMRDAIARAKAIKEVSVGMRTYCPDGSENRYVVRSERMLSKRS